MGFVGFVLSPITCLLWIIVGAVAGSLANQLVGTRRSNGFVPELVLGLVGAVVGGMVLSFFGLYPVTGSVWNPIACCGHIIVATFGACLLIIIGRMVTGQRRV